MSSLSAVTTQRKIICTNDRVCIFVQILHALFEAPEAADTTLQATLGTWIITAFTPDNTQPQCIQQSGIQQQK